LLLLLLAHPAAYCELPPLLLVKSFDDSLKAGLTAGALSGATHWRNRSREKKPLLLLKQVKASKLYQANHLNYQKTQVLENLITEPSLLGDQTKVSGTGLTEKVPTGGGQGLTANTRDFLPASLRRYDTDNS
jgi:hypothetical protein